METEGITGGAVILGETCIKGTGGIVGNTGESTTGIEDR